MKISEKIQTTLPLIQAPLAGYPNQAQLVATISNNGALGVLNTDTLTTDAINKDITSIRKATNKPFAVAISLKENNSNIDLADRSSTNNYLSEAYKALEVDKNANTQLPSTNDVCKAVVKARVPVIIFSNGIPTDEFIEHCNKVGITMLAVASNTLEAIAINHTQIHGIIVQGVESAGPQSRFNNDLPEHRSPSSSLLQNVHGNCNKPLFVWGDTQQPAHCKSALTNGATGIVIDTPFWSLEESPVPASYKTALQEHNEMQIKTTAVWNGTPANVIGNALTETYISKKGKVLDGGKQQSLMQPLIDAAIQADNADYLPLWSGIRAACTDSSTEELFTEYRTQLKDL